MLLPRIDNVSICTWFRPLTVILTDFMCMFILISTPARAGVKKEAIASKRGLDGEGGLSALC